jgi:hypothetical protein
LREAEAARACVGNFSTTTPSETRSVSLENKNKVKIEIKTLAGSVLFEGDFTSLAAALTAAVKSGANLDGANLDGAKLANATLIRANLYGANLYGANLYGANLYGANLDGAKNIPLKVLRKIRDDFWAVLSSAPNEVAGLRDALIAGRINGSTYTGECACLVGTIANVCKRDHTELDFLKPDEKRLAEKWFWGIKPGDTPEKSATSKQTLEWLDQWLENMKAAFGPKAPTNA